MLRLIACPHICSIEKDRLDRSVEEGPTVAEHLENVGWEPLGLSARVFIDGRYIPDSEWGTLVPRTGQCLVARAIPRGGGGGGGKDVMRMVAMIGIMALAIGVPILVATTSLIAAGTLGGALFTTAIGLVGTLAINALIPPARPKLNDLSNMSTGSNTLTISGTSNQLIPYGVVPRVYGLHRIFPPLGARHYTEVSGDRQFLRALFCFGPGPLALSDFKIGENSIDLYKDVEIEVHQGYVTDPPHTLYPAAVNEEPLSIPVKSGASPIRTSKPNANELGIDFTFPGLWKDKTNRDGIDPVTVNLRVEYRLQGDVPFLIANGAPAVRSTMTTALTGTNNDLIFTQQGAGSAAGNNISIAYVDPGVHDVASETVRVTPVGNGFAFTVILRRVGGNYSLAVQVMNALLSASFSTATRFNPTGPIRTVASVIGITLAPGNDGTGQVAPMAPTFLRGGRDETPSLSQTNMHTSQFTVPIVFKTPTPGTYEVRVTRLTADSTDPLVHDEVFWTALRTIRPGSEIDLIPPGMASVAIRIRATDQLHGTLDSFNAVAHSILPDWDGNAWVPRETSNPASIFRDIHQGTANARPKADDRMDLETLQGFHERCTQHGFEFNAVVDFRSTLSELGRDVLAAGRATPGYRDGKVSVIEDIPQTIPAHILTPRNSWDFKGTKVFSDLPHALKVRFVNADTLQQDEVVVIADGYGVTDAEGIRRDAFGHPTTLPEATKFEAWEAGLGVNVPAQIFKIKRYHLAVLALRPETYSVSSDFENLVMRPGDLVKVQHDIPLFGLCSGRIVGLTQDALGRATTITLDEPCVMLSGERYGIRLRLQDGTQLQREVQTVVGAQSTLTLLEPV